jgi:integrase
MNINITEKFLQGLKATDERQVIRDPKQVGFGVRVEPKAIGGRVSFFWNQKVCGKVFFRSLGTWPEVAVKSARDAAGILAGDAKKWRAAGCKSCENPFAKQKASTSAAPTFSQLVESYVTNHLHDPKAEINHPDKAERELRWAIKKYFQTWLEKRVDEITVRDVIQLRDANKKTPYVANRNVQTVRGLLGWCMGGKDGKVNVWELPSNPAARVELFPEKERERYLSPEEQVMLEDALEDDRTPADLRDFVLLSLSTGARKMSLLLAEWTEFDFEVPQWTIPAEHSKSGRSYIVDLLPEAIEVLERRKEERTTSPLVFPPISGSYLHLDKPFRRLMVRIAAEYRRDHNGQACTLETDPVRIHDLRRTLGATMACNGASLEQIAKALGQESVSATSIYARLSRQSVRQAREDANAKRREHMGAARKRLEGQREIHPITAGGAQ